jgi:glyoxylase-like metal-dependent hydrolase (beta-lactamase superfamily II)
MAHRLKKMSGAELFVHELDRDIVERFSEGTSRFIERYKEFMLKNGLPKNIYEVLMEFSQFAGTFGESVKVDTVLKDGDVLRINGDRMEVIHTPGHSSGSVCFYLPHSRILFSGDTILRDVTPNPFYGGEFKNAQMGLIHFLASLDKLKPLAIDKIYPGHGEELDSQKAIIEMLEQHHSMRKSHIEKIMGAEALNAYQITERLFGELPLTEVWLGLTEVMAHLELLVAEGRAECVELEGIYYYRLK